MVKLLDLLVYTGIFFTVFMIRSALPQGLGGCTFLFILFPAFWFLPLFPDVKKERLYLNTILACLIWLNYADYVQREAILSPSLVFVLYSFLVGAILLGFALMSSQPLHNLQDISNVKRVSVLRYNFKWIVYRYPMLAFLYSLFFSMVFLTIYGDHSFGEVKLPMIATAFLMVPLLLAGMLYSLTEWGGRKLDFILKTENAARLSEPNHKRVYAILMMVIASGGTALEVVTRNNLALWAETIVTIHIAISLVWRIRIHTRTGTVDYQEAPEEPILNTPRNVMKLTVIHGLVGGGLSVILLIYLMSTLAGK